MAWDLSEFAMFLDLAVLLFLTLRRCDLRNAGFASSTARWSLYPLTALKHLTQLCVYASGADFSRNIPKLELALQRKDAADKTFGQHGRPRIAPGHDAWTSGLCEVTTTPLCM